MPSALLSRAFAQGFPLFLDGNIDLASPSTASPFPTSRAFMQSTLAFTAARAELFDAFEQLISALGTRIRIDVIMVGGSFLRPSVTIPKDLDAVLFYSVPEEDNDIGSFLHESQQAARKAFLDVRFVPTDADPQLLIRAACFFSGLYAQVRSAPAHAFGTLLIQGSEFR